MKLTLLYLALFISFAQLSAQNIGIGTTSPTAKLSIAGSSTSPNGQEAALKIQNTASSNAWYLRGGATGTSTPDGGFSIADNTSYHFNIDKSGNIGIGTIIPTQRLHIASGNIQLDNATLGINLNAADLPLISRRFDEFLSGAYQGIGRWGLFMEPNVLTLGIPALPLKSLSIASYYDNSKISRELFKVQLDGAGNTATTSILGDMNIEGQLKLNGSTGSSGQVLTSNGVAAPSWRPQSLNNNVRFAVQLDKNATTENGDCVISATKYNLSPADISIGASSITINKSGLYHFDISLSLFINFSTARTTYPLYNIVFYSSVATQFSLANDVMNPNSTANTNWNSNYNGSLDVYITAPATIKLYHAMGVLFATPAAYGAKGYLAGYLISE